MKPTELKQRFVELRAAGQSYTSITEQLHISKSTCTSWEQELQEEIAQQKKEELNTLYDSYYMTKEARIRQLGETLQSIDNALEQADLTEASPEKLLDYKLKYVEALKGEYINTTEPAFKPGKTLEPTDIVNALADLLNRIRAGEVTAEQANRESLVLSNLLKAYETTELKAKLDALEAIVGGDN